MVREGVGAVKCLRLFVLVAILSCIYSGAEAIDSSSINARIQNQTDKTVKVSGPAATLQNLIMPGASTGPEVNGGSHDLLQQITDDTGACLWSLTTAAPNSLQQCGNEFRGNGILLRDDAAITSRTINTLSDAFNDGTTAVTVVVNPTANTEDLAGLRIIHLDKVTTQQDSSAETDGMSLAAVRDFVGADDSSPAFAPATPFPKHHGFACIQGGSGGRVCATSGEDLVNFIGSSNVTITCSIITGQKVCRIIVQQGIPATFALYVDAYYCNTDFTSCGSITSPCCSPADSLKRAQLNNDAGFATCSLNPTVGCGRCSTSSGVQCNEDRDCPLNFCSVTQTQLCDRDGDCPWGEVCDGATGNHTHPETCIADSTVCAQLPTNGGTCTGPTKFYGHHVGAGTYVQRLPKDLWRPGFQVLLGSGRSTTILEGFGVPGYGADGAGRMKEKYPNPNECLVDLTDTVSCGTIDMQINGALGVGACAFGNTLFSGFIRTNVTALGDERNTQIYFGPTRDYLSGAQTQNAKYAGQALITNGMENASLFSNSATSQAVHFSPRRNACSDDWNRSCLLDSDCSPWGTCAIEHSADFGFFPSMTTIEGGNVGIDIEGMACGSSFNIILDAVRMGISASPTASLPSIGMKIHHFPNSCRGRYSCVDNPSACLHPEVRTWDVGVYGVESNPYSNPNISISVEDNWSLYVRGPMRYDACRRHIDLAHGAMIRYAGGNPTLNLEPIVPHGEPESGSTSDLGQQPCDAIADVQEGESWCTPPSAIAPSTVTLPNRCFKYTSGRIVQQPYAAVYNPVTGAMQFAGNITKTIDILTPNNTAAIRMIGNDIVNFPRQSGLRSIALNNTAFDTINGEPSGSGIGDCGESKAGQGALCQECSLNNQLCMLSWVQPVDTPTPTAALTATPTFTPTSTKTATVTPTGPTLTPTFTATTALTNTPANTNTPTPTFTPTPTYNVAQPSWTPTFTLTVTVTRTNTTTRTPTYTPDFTATAVNTFTPTVASKSTPVAQFDGFNDRAVGFAHLWVGDVSLRYGTPTPKFDCPLSAANCQVIAPSANTDIANKAYVDGLTTGDSTYVKEADIGTGLSVTTGTVNTQSDEAGFLAAGALTCGAATAGKMKVHTTPLQYCDNAATPALQYAAYGSVTGVATSATALAADPANCSANNAAGGITAAGVAEACIAPAILAGISGGQTLNGDTASGGNLTLVSTAHATKGKILLGAANSAYDEANIRLGLGTASPGYRLEIDGATNSGTEATMPQITLKTAGTTGSGAQILFDSSSTTGGFATYLYASGPGNGIGAGYFAVFINSANRLWLNSTGQLGLNVAPSAADLAMVGTANKVWGMERNSTAATAGKNLTLQAGGAIAGTNNLAGGDLLLAAGTATGNGAAKVDVQTVVANQGTGSTDRTVTTQTRFRDGHIVATGTALGTGDLSGCGSSPNPSIVGNDQAGVLTLGGSSPTACVITFKKAYTTNAPACTANNATSNTATRQPKPTTTTTTLTLTATFTNGDVIHYICMGIE